ncbi:MAG TPA: Gldg family protein [Steroidobacteraceae bacterium]|nr:Gldg family protein [Steroidobacteraceae bacterium]
MATASPKLLGRRSFGAGALIALAAIFIGLTMLLTFGLRGWRLDFTDNHLYSLAAGTKNTLAKLQEPINLYFFYSSKLTGDLPDARAYAARVRELLQEIEARSNGKIRLSVIDPEPFSEEEDRATEFGLQGAPYKTDEKIYFGLAGTNSTDGQASIAFFDTNRAQFLEYDVVRLIHELATPKKPVVGLITGLPMDAGYNPMTQQMREPWTVLSQLEQLFNVRTLKADLKAIDADVDVLMIVHPKELAPAALYAIDQFVLRGGKALVFVDPQAEQDTAGQDPNQPFANFGVSKASTLEPLLGAWGVEFKPNEIVGDLATGLNVSNGQDSKPVRHIAILGLPAASFNHDDVVTSQLETVNVYTAGHFSKRKDAKITFEPLIQSSAEAGILPVERVRMATDPATLRDGFKPTGERYVIAARIGGTLTSAYPNGSPAAAEGPIKGLPAVPLAANDHLTTSRQPANIILVADTDLLGDLLWVRSRDFFGQRFATAWASNGDFVANSLDNLTGSADLISIRSRANYSRPFTRVDDIKRQAEEHFRAKEQELQHQLTDAEQKLSELQSRRNDQSSLILTPEQEKEVANFQVERTRIRKELREVQHGLAQNIETLGNWLKAINILLMPLLVAACGFAVLSARSRRRTAGTGSKMT